MAESVVAVSLLVAPTTMVTPLTKLYAKPPL